MRLEGKTALIMGASSGIGRASAVLFAQEGAKVVVTARRAALLDDLVSEIDGQGGNALAVAGDSTLEETPKRAVEAAVSTFGGLDIAFNNGGTLGAIGPVPEMSLEGWNETLNGNLTSAFLAAKHQLPALLQRGNGAMLFTSSFVGHTVGFPSMAAYAASKAGLVGLTQTLASEYGPQGLRVNALLPGATNTEMAADFAKDPQMLDFIKGLYALKRIADPEEMARAALFLVSGEASFVTGQAVLVDGGVSITRT